MVTCCNMPEEESHNLTINMLIKLQPQLLPLGLEPRGPELSLPSKSGINVETINQSKFTSRNQHSMLGPFFSKMHPLAITI